jgi:hypothetical protein
MGTAALVKGAKGGSPDIRQQPKEAPLALHADAPPFQAVGDGTSRPLAQRYSTLAAARADYPHATALTDELDWAAIQGAINRATATGTLGGKVVLPLTDVTSSIGPFKPRHG